MGSEAPKEKTDAALEDMKQSLDLLEDKFLQDKPFVVGSQVSLADVVAVVEIMQPLGTGVDGFEGRPRLMAWRERVREGLGGKLFDQAHERLLDSEGLQRKMQSNSQLEKFKPLFQKFFN